MGINHIRHCMIFIMFLFLASASLSSFAEEQRYFLFLKQNGKENFSVLRIDSATGRVWRLEENVPISEESAVKDLTLSLEDYRRYTHTSIMLRTPYWEEIPEKWDKTFYLSDKNPSPHFSQPQSREN